MPSIAFRDGISARAAALDGIEDAHRSIGGSGPGRRTATQQLNQLYAVMRSSQFQAFCRDLHTECAKSLVAPVSAPDLQEALYANAVFGRKLDTGNPNPGNIGADFNRLRLMFWPTVEPPTKGVAGGVERLAQRDCPPGVRPVDAQGRARRFAPVAGAGLAQGLRRPGPIVRQRASRSPPEDDSRGPVVKEKVR
jgi:hypothetical protein